MLISRYTDENSGLTKPQASLKDIKNWMSRDILLLNSDKTGGNVLGVLKPLQIFS